VIDLHCHVLAGLDDGPPAIEDSLALARAAAASGTTTLIATPHVSWEYPNSAEAVAAAVAGLNERLKADAIALEIGAGAEIALTRVGDIDGEELSRLTLGGGPYLLVEPPFSPVAIGLARRIEDLQECGFPIVLAHPERCPVFHRDRSILERLVESGVLTSITAGSFDGRFGTVVRRFSVGLMRDGLVHNVASDAHDEFHRPPSIAAELERAGLARLTMWLTQAVPSAILEGRDIPPRPNPDLLPTTPSRPRWLLGRRSKDSSEQSKRRAT
jgi:protein-tyrosine phosphatase